MEKKVEDRIKHPYKTPEGYFENFEERLRGKLPKQAPLFVTYQKQNKRLNYWLGAAAVMLLCVFAWLINSKKQTKPMPEMAQKMQDIQKAADSAALLTLIAKHEKNEEKLMEDIAREIQEKPIVTPPAPNATEKQIADELEEEGIIAAEINDNLFDEFEILP